MKKCTHCQKEKEAEKFPSHRQTKDGLGSWCRDCVGMAAKAWGDRNREELEKGERSVVERKVCCRCKEEKVKTEFYKNKKRKDGLQEYCIVCAKKTYYARTEGKVKRRMSSLERLEAARLYSTTKTSIPKLAKRFGVSNPTMQRSLIDLEAERYSPSYKTCSICQRNLPFESFYKRTGRNFRGDGRYSSCRECRNRKYIERTYGLETANLVSSAKFCEICERPWGSLRIDSPNVDHSHVTGAVRGVICGKCNLSLGYADDDPTIFQRMIKYLERHSDAKPIPSSDPLCWAIQ